MPEYRRAFVPGGTFFFTAVTYGRSPVFAEERAVDLLRDAFREARRVSPFTVDAVVVLPDHVHTLWTLPPGDPDFSSRWRYLKRVFSQSYAKTFSQGAPNERRADGRWTIWQPRFWERLVRDVAEFQALADYIHYNP
ncbi:MAG TPA: transposase [Pirellulaceae bacterium]|jgi:putative transposase|nr:transposase [Pirellulaceae bacterium]